MPKVGLLQSRFMESQKEARASRLSLQVLKSQVVKQQNELQQLRQQVHQLEASPLLEEAD